MHITPFTTIVVLTPAVESGVQIGITQQSLIVLQQKAHDVRLSEDTSVGGGFNFVLNEVRVFLQHGIEIILLQLNNVSS